MASIDYMCDVGYAVPPVCYIIKFDKEVTLLYPTVGKIPTKV